MARRHSYGFPGGGGHPAFLCWRHRSRALPALKDGNWDTLKVVWDKPEAVPSETGCPIGNGHIGTRIRGGIGSETIRP
jgi:hypothetical protein